MYQKQYGRDRSSRPSRYSSGGGGGNFRPRSQGGNRGGARHRTKSIDPALLIKKAAEPVVAAAPSNEPQHSFSEFGLAPQLEQAVVSQGFTVPTPIQVEAIPQLLAGRDVVGIANTGTGKTAAFLLPVLHKLLQDRSQKALIVAPTRELAAQIKDDAQKFAQQMPFSAALCIGGVPMFRQIESLRRRPDIVIGTPGRLKDLNNQNKLNFGFFTTIILDEVDRMLDMGFVADVRYIVDQLPLERQSVFFSATLSPAVKSVMQAFLTDPVIISVKSQETAVNVDQDVIRLKGQQKIDVLHELLKQEGFDKVIVFGRTKRGIEKLEDQLYRRGFDVVALHGNKSQGQRLRALDHFKKDRVTILLATDVAARGLDISDVTHVINYDLPETYDDYVHRIGRTGRANKKGVALSLID